MKNWVRITLFFLFSHFGTLIAQVNSPLETHESKAESFCRFFEGNLQTKDQGGISLFDLLTLNLFPHTTFEFSTASFDELISEKSTLASNVENHDFKNDDLAMENVVVYFPSVDPDLSDSNEIIHELKTVRKTKLSKKLGKTKNYYECLSHFLNYPSEANVVLDFFQKINNDQNYLRVAQESSTINFLKKKIPNINLILSPDDFYDLLKNIKNKNYPNLLLIGHSDLSGKIHLPWGGTIPNNFFRSLKLNSLTLAICNFNSVKDLYLNNLNYPVFFPKLKNRFADFFKTQLPITVAPSLLRHISKIKNAKILDFDIEKCNLVFENELHTIFSYHDAQIEGHLVLGIFMNGDFISTIRFPLSDNLSDRTIYFPCSYLENKSLGLVLGDLGKSTKRSTLINPLHAVITDPWNLDFQIEFQLKPMFSGLPLIGNVLLSP